MGKFDGKWDVEMGFQSYSRDLDDSNYAVEKEPYSRNGANGFFKRATDFLIALVALVFLLPILIPIAIAIRISDGGPALFKQTRIGRDGNNFRCYKFRSMVIDADVRLKKLLDTDPRARREWQATQKLENDPRITAFGRFLRKSSLDELPQLINILRGDMSIVGPRPIVQNEIEKYGDYFTYYCQVRPGLTGLWQVSGRSDTSYGERVALDVRYVSDWSYSSDIKIMMMTVPAVLLSDGAK
ncbi:MAG: sugar transferase [Pseudomonadota bacterium]